MLILPTSCSGARTSRIWKNVHMKVTNPLCDLEGMLEIGLRFAGKTADNVGRNSWGQTIRSRQGLIDLINHFQVVTYPILAIHLAQDGIGARLQG